MPELTRRQIIASGAGTATTGLLTGCLSDGDPDDTASAGGDGDEEDPANTGSGDGGAAATSSFFVFGDFAQKVVGDTAESETLVPVGQHGHGWEPGPQIQGEVLESNLFFHGPEGFQPWVDDLAGSLRDDGADVTMVSVADGIGLVESGHDHGGEGAHEDEHDHGERSGSPWEHAGLYHLEAGSYSYTFGEGPDPEMSLAVLRTDEGGDHGIEHAEETARQLYASEHETHTVVGDGGSLVPSQESLYTLEFADSGETTFTLDIDTEGHYVLFSQHVPSEFNATLAEDGVAIEPEVSEAAGEHDHEGEEDHEDEHGHEDGHDEHGGEGEHSHEEEDHDEHEGESEEDGHGHDHGGTDPHFWLDPERAKEAVGNVSDAFAEVDEENADVYAENADEYRSRLDELDETYSSELGDAPKDVVFVAGHDAFGYLADRYGFEVETLTGISPDDRPTPRDIERAQGIIEEHDIEYVCADPLESDRAANQLVEETDATEVLPLTPIPGRTEGWEENGWGYVEVMENTNLDTLTKALGAE